MKILIIGIAVMIAPFAALAQEDARDIAREMGSDTTTSVSPGADRTGVHRDTENVEPVAQRAPNLLESAQTSRRKKMSNKERRELLRKRASLIEDRKNAVDAAAKKAEQAPKASPAEKSFVATKEATVEDAREKAKSHWDAKRGGELRKIERALKTTSEEEGAIGLKAPALVKPK